MNALRNVMNQIIDKTKSKHVILNEVDFKIIDVPNQVLATIKRGNDIDPNFNLQKASSFIKEMVKRGYVYDDLNNRMAIAACDKHTPLSTTFTKDNNTALTNLCPKCKPDYLEKALNKNKQILLDTVTLLLKSKKLYLKRLPKNKEPKKIIEIQDPLVSVQLDAIFKEFEKDRIKKEGENEKRKQIRQAQKNGSLIECECCICEYPIDWMIQCPEGHLMCKFCIQKQIETTIAEGKSNIKCLKFGGECEMEISMNELQRLIPEKTIKRLIQTETLNAITAAKIENTVKCHSCGFIVIVDEKEGPMNCPQCKAQTCIKCGSEWHKNMTCEQFSKFDKERLLEEKMNEAVVRICPQCKTQFIKEEGCNKMECPRCGTWICYWCRKIIPKNIGYSHFWQSFGICPPDRCPLWVDNKTLHNIEAKNAKINSKKA